VESVGALLTAARRAGELRDEQRAFAFEMESTESKPLSGTSQSPISKTQSGLKASDSSGFGTFRKLVFRTRS
jgi:hypothetical protein